jgi:hypothetical protein
MRWWQTRYLIRDRRRTRPAEALDLAESEPTRRRTSPTVVSAATGVLEPQVKKLDWLCRRNQHEQILLKAVTGPVNGISADRGGRLSSPRRRKAPAFDVQNSPVSSSKINDFARRIADRVVAPGREAVHLTVACPGITAATSVTRQPKSDWRAHSSGAGGRSLPRREMTYSLPSVVNPPLPLLKSRRSVTASARRPQGTGAERGKCQIRCSPRPTVSGWDNCSINVPSLSRRITRAAASSSVASSRQGLRHCAEISHQAY